jgi:hypothetical protein
MTREDGGGPKVRYHACEVCGDNLIPQRMWNAAGKAERREMRAEGFARQGNGPQCSRCTTAARRSTDG